jgi:hypothetical protein
MTVPLPSHQVPFPLSVFFVRAGTSISRLAKDRGCSVVRSYCGHGIGNLFHTTPNVPHYAKNKAIGIMRAGHTFTIEPMINQVRIPLLSYSLALLRRLHTMIIILFIRAAAGRTKPGTTTGLPSRWMASAPHSSSTLSS